MEIDNSKYLSEKNIIEKHTTNGQFKLSLALLELERINKEQEIRIQALEEAMMFFSNWYNTTQRPNILVPDNLDENGNTKLIL
jgi:hypothetical protein